MRNHLPDNHGLTDTIQEISALNPQDNGEISLTEIQFDALSAGVARGNSILVSAPTSTGKTLIGLWAIAASIESGKKAVYIVSHRALAKQKFQEITSVFGNNILGGDLSSIVVATGDGVEDATGRRTSSPLNSKVIVATYEKFLQCLSIGGLPSDLTNFSIICDEIQIVGEENRGKDVELLLTLLKRAGWNQFVGLSAVLSPSDTDQLAAWLGVVAVRNSTREKALHLQCRTPDFVLEARAQPGQRTSAIGKVQKRAATETGKIVRELIRTETQRPVIVFCMRIDDTYELASEWVQQHTGPKSNISVPDGNDINIDLIKSMSCRAAYHNAELSEDEREFVEEKLAEGLVDVVFATSTLAAGVNFPLGSAVFHSWKRWNSQRRSREPISRPEFQNMAGRVGRMGQSSTEGTVVMTATDGDILAATKLMDLDASERLVSRIGPDDFGQLLLHIFAAGICGRRDEAYEIIAETLSASREFERNRSGLEAWQDRVYAEVDNLIGQECLIENNKGAISTTTYGTLVARSGLKPETAKYLITSLADNHDWISEAVKQDDEELDNDLLFILTHGAFTSSEFSREGGTQTRDFHWRIKKSLAPNSWARKLSLNLFTRPWTADIGSANAAMLVSEWASGTPRAEVEKKVDAVRIGTVQNCARDAAWILTGIAEIISGITNPNFDEFTLPSFLRGKPEGLVAVRGFARTIRRQATRIALGLPSNVLWTTRLTLNGPRPKLSRPEVLALRAGGLASAIDLMRGDPEADQKRRDALMNAGVADPQRSSRLRDAVRTWKNNERKHWRRLHERRADALGHGDLIRRLYSAKGNELETVLEEVFQIVGASFTKLDVKKTQGRPDFLLEVTGCDPIVIEVKTKQSDSDFVGLNDASEVLMASELIKRKDNHCVTICSPAVDPSVPAQIEACGRLCVVDIGDLAEAIVRVLSGKIDIKSLHSWLMVPGLAVVEDLPPA